MNDTFKAPYSTYPDDRAFWRIRDGLGNLVARDFDEDEAKELARKLNEHAAQSARIAELEAQVKSLTQTLDLIMEVHPTKNKDNYPFVVRQLVQMNRARALLETK